MLSFTKQKYYDIELSIKVNIQFELQCKFAYVLLILNFKNFKRKYRFYNALKSPRYTYKFTT